jgi:hypothetical protein
MSIQNDVLSDQNIENVYRVSRQFLQDKYNFQVQPNELYANIQQILRELVQYYTAKPPFPPILELNKMTISEIKNKVLKLLSQQQSSQNLSAQKPTLSPSSPMQPPSMQPSHNLSNEPSQQNSPSFQLQSPPLMEQMSSDIDSIHEVFQETGDISVRDEKNEDEFFKKLQVLELQRNTQITSQHAPTSDPISVKSNVNAPPQVPLNTIIYMSPTNQEIRNSKPIIIHGSDRMWLHIRERNMLSFNGPLPDSVHVRLTNLMISPKVARITPCVIVQIKSATGKLMEVYCYLDKQGPTWDIWKPVSRTLSLIKTFACPWVITLLDIHGTPLDMGKDGQKIIQVNRLLDGKSIRIDIEPDSDVQTNTFILIQTSDGIITKVPTLHALSNQIQIPGEYIDIKPFETYICNLQAQPYIMLEMEKFEVED